MSTFQRDGFALLLVLGLASFGWADSADLAKAHKFYNLTEFDQSLKVLLAISEKDASVYQLIGQNYYGRAEYKRATEALEKAVVLDRDGPVGIATELCAWWPMRQVFAVGCNPPARFGFRRAG